MPHIAELPPTQAPALVSYFHANRRGDAPDAQGIEGRKVFAKTEAVYRHWTDRAEVLVTRREEADAFSAAWTTFAERTYERVPPNRMFYVKTRYVYLGKGLPHPFDLDDE